MKGWFICPTCGHVVGTRGRGPILCKDGHKGERRMDFVGEGEEGRQEVEKQIQIRIQEETEQDAYQPAIY